MMVIKCKKECSGCYACLNKCPKKCITMKEDNEGFKYPCIDKEKCVKCGACENVCPILNCDKDSKAIPECYAAYNKDINIRMDSSSGGIFDLIARNFIGNKGVVYGAAFDDENNVKHIRVDKIDDLYKLRKSKYVQSEIGECYKNVENDLKK